MLRIKMYELSVGGVVQRFYTMMAGTIIMGFLGQFLLATVWAMIFAVSSILGVKVSFSEEQRTEKSEGRIVPVDTKPRARKRA